MTDETPPTCIYCDRPGPFTGEHIVPAGLGGDDAWQLRGLVCHICNTERFSKLEAQFLREGAVAIPRIFLQPKGRGKGKKATDPSINVPHTFFEAPGSRVALEALLTAGGRPTVLPQIIVGDTDKLALTGGAESETRAFLDALPNVLADRLPLIRKRKAGPKATYDAAWLRWSGRSYERESGSEETGLASPPDPGIWLEELRRPATLKPETVLTPRLFQRPEGQFVIRVERPEHAEIVLSAIRLGLAALQGLSIPQPTAALRPDIHLGVNFNGDVYLRVLAKIGVNLAISEFGEQFVRDSAFAPIKRAILSGNEPIGRIRSSNGSLFKPVFDLVSGRHVMALWFGDGPKDVPILALCIRLYGGPIEVTKLAEIAAPVGYERPIYFALDYTTRKMERFPSPEFEEWLVATGRGSSS